MNMDRETQRWCIAQMKEIQEDKDAESRHWKADSLLLTVLRHHGEFELAEMYEQMMPHFWYA